MKELSNEDIHALMLALGFHRIPSRNRWKMKLCDTFELTDWQLENANMRGVLEQFLIDYLEKQYQSKRQLERMKKIALALFRS